MKKSSKLVFSVLVAGMLLGGCGGGGSNDSTPNNEIEDGTMDNTTKLDSRILTINTGENITINKNSDVTLTANIADGSTEIAKYTWKEGGAILSTQKSFTKSDFSEGTHTITVTIEDTQGKSTSKTITIIVENKLTYKKPLKTGQTISYYLHDDGDLQKGIDASYSRDDTKEIVTNNNNSFMWQDNEAVKTTKLTWDEANNYCQSLTLGTYSDWRLPNMRELINIRLKGVYKKSLDSAFQNRIDSEIYYKYWSSTESLENSANAGMVNFGNAGYTWWESKNDTYYVRCIRN